MKVWVLAVMCGAAVLVAADTPQQGAKGLFVDQLSQSKIPTGPTAQQGPRTTSAGSSSANTATSSPPKNTGLMYYLELVKPSGEVLRVNSTRAFRSGDRVRIHFTSNVDGRLVIVQKQKDGTSEVLFPDKRVRSGDNRLKAGEDMVVPSERAWFTFDSNPGEERLMVFLTTEASYGTFRPMVADATLNGGKTVLLASNIERQRGSKALKLEVDESSAQPATYVVMNAIDETPQHAPARQTRTATAAQSGVVATEIVLSHQ